MGGESWPLLPPLDPLVLSKNYDLAFSGLRLQRVWPEGAGRDLPIRVLVTRIISQTLR